MYNGELDNYSNFSLADTFNKVFTTEEGRKRRAEKRDTKLATQQSEAQLNAALAQAAMQDDKGGLSTGAMIGIGVGILALATIAVIVIKKAKK